MSILQKKAQMYKFGPQGKHILSACLDVQTFKHLLLSVSLCFRLTCRLALFSLFISKQQKKGFESKHNFWQNYLKDVKRMHKENENNRIRIKSLYKETIYFKNYIISFKYILFQYAFNSICSIIVFIIRLTNFQIKTNA